MGFGLWESTAPLAAKKAGRRGAPSLALLHSAECALCPLNEALNLNNPKMKPSGATSPDVYLLGAAPGDAEDRLGKHMAGDAGKLVRENIPHAFGNLVRWNNVIRTSPPKGREPSRIEVECCRPSVERDIVARKPLAIIGFGAVPLEWATGERRITTWSGRRIPVDVAGYKCWFYPMLHPTEVLRKWREMSARHEGYGSEDEFQFAMDMRRAFREIEDGLPEPIIHTPDMARDGCESIYGDRGEEDCDRIVRALEDLAHRDDVQGIDFETNGLRPYRTDAKILTAAVAVKGWSFSFPIEKRGHFWNDRQLKRIHKAMHRYLIEARGVRAVHQLSFDLEWACVMYGPEVARTGNWICTQSQAYLLDERQGGHSLDFVCKQYFGLDLKAISGLNRKDIDQHTLKEVVDYNALDSKYHRLAAIVQGKRIRDEGLSDVEAHHMRRIPACVLTQLKGFPIHQPTVQEFAKKYTLEILDVEDEINRLECVQEFKRRYGEAFNPASVPHVLKLFNKILQIPILEKAAKGGEMKVQADAETMKGIDHPIADLIVRWRKPSKLMNPYITSVNEEFSFEDQATGDTITIPRSETLWPDGLIHPIISTNKVKTWRTSSEEPNSQNYPKRGPNKIIRRIAAKPGHKICSFDFAGIQARNVAMESKDATLIKYFWDRYDIHSDWLERLVRKYPRAIKEGAKKLANDKALFKEYRNSVKNKFVFPSFFGAGAGSIAANLHIPREISDQMHDDFWGEFPDIKYWHEDLRKFYRKHGYVTGLSGFRRRAPVGHNELINAPIQGDESIIVLGAMCRLSEMDLWRYQANLEIHDDLTFVWPTEKVDEYAPIVIKEMLRIEYDWINVPLQVELSVGDNWADQEAVGEYASDTWDGETVRKG